VSVWLAADSAVIVGTGSHPVRSDFSRPGYSLMAGEVASLLLSRMTVPILYYQREKRMHHHQLASRDPRS
jgi:hypothetical protein